MGRLFHRRTRTPEQMLEPQPSHLNEAILDLQNRFKAKVDELERQDPGPAATLEQREQHFAATNRVEGGIDVLDAITKAIEQDKH